MHRLPRVLKIKPNSIRNTQREDIIFIGFQIWVFGMSTVAILNESIPHTLAALATHALATAWSGYQLVNTASFQSEFVRSTIKSGLCGDGTVNLLPNYWAERRAAEITVLVINAVALLMSAALSWKLVKVRLRTGWVHADVLYANFGYRCSGGKHSRGLELRWRLIGFTRSCSLSLLVSSSPSSSSVCVLV